MAKPVGPPPGSDPEPPLPPGEKGPFGKILEEAGTGISFAFSIVLGTLLGLWLDRWWDHEPWGLILGLVWGFGGAVKILMDAHRRLMGNG